jgi:hypothetical protein
MFNNTSAKYTKYEQYGSNNTDISGAEVSLAKAMLTRNINDFNHTASNLGYVDSAFNLVDPSGQVIAYPDGSTETVQLTHVMINNQVNDVGSVFALAAKHNFDNTQSLITDPSSKHPFFSTTSGYVDSDLGFNVSNNVYLTNDSAAYYDSQILVSTDNTEHNFYDNELSVDNKYHVIYDTTSSNYNAEKAVNSRFSSWTTDASGADPSGNDLNGGSMNDPLSIYEHTTFNTEHALYTENIVTRNSTNNMLGATGPITLGMRSLVNENGQHYYDVSGNIGIDSTTHSADNDRVFFGAIKAYQAPKQAIVNDFSTGVAGSTGTNGTTLARIPSDQGSPLPTSFTENEFDALFTSDELKYVGDGYTLEVTKYSGDGGVTGGYATDFRGFTTDDSDVIRNTKYMRICSEEGDNFARSEQTVHILNGDLDKYSNNAGPNSLLLTNRVDSYVEGAEVPHDTDESLDSCEYDNDYYVRTYFTEPDSNVASSYPRVTDASGNTANYTKLRVVYDSSEGDECASTLEESRKTIYYDKFDITTVFPATGVTGAVFSGSNFIGVNNGFSAVFQQDASGVNLNTDYTFSSTSDAADLVGNEEVLMIQVNNRQYMAGEHSLYVGESGNHVPHTNANAIGENIIYTSLQNSDPNGATDLRIQIDAKTGLESTLTHDWSFGLTQYSTQLVTDLAIPTFLGSDIYSITSDLTNTVSMDFEVITNGSADNRDGLNREVLINWVWGDASYSKIITESDITFLQATDVDGIPIPVAIETSSALTKGVYGQYNFNIPNTTGSASVTSIQSLLANVDVKRRVELQNVIPQFKLELGPYNNLIVTGAPIVIRTVYHVLVNKNTQALLSDSYSRYLELSSSYLATLEELEHSPSKASRQIIGKKSSHVDLKASDLLGFTAHVEKKDGDSWTRVSGEHDFDCAYHNFTVFTLDNDAGTISASVDISTGTSNDSTTNVVLDQPLYHIDLSTSHDTLSYAVSAKKWDLSLDASGNPVNLTDAEAIRYWAADNTIYSTSMPTDGTEVPMIVSVTFESGSSNNQPHVTIIVTDPSGNVEWAKFVTNGVNATSNFNVLFARRPVFHIVESSGDEEVLVVDTYKMAGSTTMLQVVDGVELHFLYDTGLLDHAGYVLRGDYIEASLYTGYAGTYSTIHEVTHDYGLLIGDAKARKIDIRYYRGNSVAHTSSSTTATYEEFLWNRIVTQIQMKIVNTDASGAVLGTYTDSLDDLYNGSLHIVDDLTTMGDLQLKFNGHLSRFKQHSSTGVNVVGFDASGNDLYSTDPSGNYTYDSTSVKNEMSVPIAITFGRYIWSIKNPYNQTEDGYVNALSDASGVLFTSNYSIVNYTGSNAMNIVASRVMIRNDERYQFKYSTPDLKIYYLAEQYVGNPATFVWSNAPEIDSISYDDLFSSLERSLTDNGQTRFINMPYTTNMGDNGSSIISIYRAPISTQEHTGYFLMPRPQHVVEAIATNDVSNLPYNYNTANRTVRYFDINLEVNEHKPFEGYFGKNNGYRVVNDMTIKFKNSEKYLDRVYNADGETNWLRQIYIPSNKVTVDMYMGYPIHTADVESANRIVTVYNGYIHEISNYDYTTYVDEAKETYIKGYFNRDNKMEYDLYFSQDTTVISPQITPSAIYGQLGDNIVNIEVRNFAPFMNLKNVTQENRHLDLLTGDSVQLVLYGHSFDTDASGNTIVNFVRYTSGTGYDFSSNTAQFLITNLGFHAMTRETATVIIRENDNVLSAQPYNFIVDCVTKANGLTGLHWETDGVFSTDHPSGLTLDFNLVCLSTVGQSKLTEIMGVSANSPIRMLVCSYPNRIDLRTGDGSPVYIVNAFGKLRNILTQSQVVELTPSLGNATNIPAEYNSYNVLQTNTI